MTLAVRGGMERAERRRQVGELTAEGWSPAEVAELLGVARPTVDADLEWLARERRRQAVEWASAGRAAVAFTPDRGWHMVEVPPAWLLDLLAEDDVGA